MKPFKILTESQEAQMTAGFLKANGIEAHVNGAKEYVSFIIGGGLGHFVIKIDEENFERAEQLLAERESSIVAEEPLAPDHFRRAIFHAILSIIFPILFHLAAIHSTYQFWQGSPKDVKTGLQICVIGLLMLPGAWLVLFYSSNL